MKKVKAEKKESKLTKFRYDAKAVKDSVVLPVSKILHKWHITPLFLSIIGLISGLIGAFFLVYSPKWVWVFVLLHLIFDNLDGALARYSNNATVVGGWIDYAIDRIVRIAYIISTIIIFDGAMQLVCIWILAVYVFMNLLYLLITRHYKYYIQLDYVIYILFVINIYFAVIISAIKLCVDIIMFIYQTIFAKKKSFHQKKSVN